MSTIEVTSRGELEAALEKLKPGDCLQAPDFRSLAQSVGELLALVQRLRRDGVELVSMQEGVDTRIDGGFFRMCDGLAALEQPPGRQRRRDGVERAREEGRYRGRKPITIDQTLFDSVVERWEQGEISAREAMSRLELKPNTFYRRIKERQEQQMKDIKQVEQELRTELRESGKQAKEAMSDLKKQVRAEAEEFRAEAKELKKAAEEKIDLHDVERELRVDRLRAEVEHRDELRKMKKDVESEAKELKKLLENQEG